MTEEITPELFEHLVDLAAFAFDPQEAEYLRNQLNQQLKAIHHLAAVDVPSDIPPASHGVTFTPQSSPNLRQDTWVPCENPEEILNLAPEVKDGYIIVPDIPHTKLD